MALSSECVGPGPSVPRHTRRRAGPGARYTFGHYAPPCSCRTALTRSGSRRATRSGALVLSSPGMPNTCRTPSPRSFTNGPTPFLEATPRTPAGVRSGLYNSLPADLRGSRRPTTSGARLWCRLSVRGLAGTVRQRPGGPSHAPATLLIALALSCWWPRHRGGFPRSAT